MVISWLKGGPEQQYKKRMHVMGKLDGEGLPRPLAAEELEIMLGNSQPSGSWDRSNSTVSDLTTGWPFLFSYPLMSAT